MTKLKQILSLALLALAIAQSLQGASYLAALYWALVAAYWSQNC